MAYPSGAADLGTVAHQALAELPNAGTVDIGLLAATYNLEFDELSTIVDRGAKLWAAIAEDYGNEVSTEVKVSSDICEGTLDIVGLTWDGFQLQDAIVGDWKTGRLRTDYSKQTLGYAYAIAATYGMPTSGIIKTQTLWVRSGVVDTQIYTHADLQNFRESALATYARAGSEYAPGDACVFCPRQHECDARTLYLLQASKALGVGSNDFDGDLLVAARQLVALAKKAEEGCREAATRAPLVAKDGTTYELQPVIRRVIKAAGAARALKSRGIDVESMLRHLKISQTDVMLLCGADTRPQRAEVWDLLEKEDAVDLSENVALVRGKPVTDNG